MSEKILLVEDRPTRQQIYSKNSGINLNEFPILKNICGGEGFYSIKKKITEEINDFDNFDVLMFHRSALSTEEKSILIRYIENSPKTLVFFSGGISTTYIQKVKKSQLLTINSKDFYSENLELFLKGEGKEISELAFGSNWMLNQLLGANEKLAFYILNFETKPLKIILDEMDFSQWIKEKYFKEDSALIDKEQLISINKEIQKDIKGLVL